MKVEDMRICLTHTAIWITQNSIVSEKPAFIFSGMLQPDGVNNAVATLRNGHGTHAEKKFGIRTGPNNTRPFNLFCPVFFSKGIFVEVGANVDGVQVIFYTPTDEELKIARDK